MKEIKTQLTVLGAGPAGYAAAFLAADLGLEVTLIDEAPDPGGVCLFRGCIPSKTLLHVSHLIEESKAASNWGITFSEPEIDLDKLRDFKDSVIKKLTGGLGSLSKQRGIQYIQGRGRYTGSTELEVDGVDGETYSIVTDDSILATGSQPFNPFADKNADRIIDSTDALELQDIPGRLLVVGAGYIGLELGSVYAALGSEVTVVEMADAMLPLADRDLVKPLQKKVEELFHNIHLSTRVKSMQQHNDEVVVTLEGKEREPLKFDRVLVSIGRKPNTSNIGLENTGVTLNDKGFVITDSTRRSTDPRIFAVGDLAGEPMLAHKGSHEAKAAVEAIAGQKSEFDPRSIPAVIYTNPEMAWCGLTESEAEEKGIEIETSVFPWAASGRSLSIGNREGITKLILEPGSGRVLGMGITGPNAGELIAEGGLAVEMAATAEDLALTIHPHPSLSETIMEAAEAYLGTSTHIYRPKKK